MKNKKIKRNYFGSIVLPITCLIFLACGNVDSVPNSVQLITDLASQEVIFKSLTAITQNSIPETEMNDSLAFLILPVQVSCPSCRKKTIDSIVKYQNNLLPNHYIIITAKGGRKIINAYFREQNANLPDLPSQIILDSIGQASKSNLFTDNTVFYYTFNRKVYLKVSAVPATVKNDLHNFFSGPSGSRLMAKENQ